MDKTQLKLEKLKAFIEVRKMYIVFWQTIILKGNESEISNAMVIMRNHKQLACEALDKILNLKEIYENI